MIQDDYENLATLYLILLSYAGHTGDDIPVCFFARIEFPRCMSWKQHFYIDAKADIKELKSSHYFPARV